MNKKILFLLRLYKNLWIFVAKNMETGEEVTITNDTEKLKGFYKDHNDYIWICGDDRHVSIMKALIDGYSASQIVKHMKNNDGMPDGDIAYYNPVPNSHGYKYYVASLGYDICAIPIDKEDENSIKANIEQMKGELSAIEEMFKENIQAFATRYDLINSYGLPLNHISYSPSQLASEVLGARKSNIQDSGKRILPDDIELKTYTALIDWISSSDIEQKSLKLDIMGIPHTFGLGGVHGAKPHTGEGSYLLMDVSSMYPSIILKYGFLSRGIPEDGRTKYETIFKERIRLKHEGASSGQETLKLILNAVCGAMNQEVSPMYDPEMYRNVVAVGQILIVSLIEKVEPYAELIQTNTDGILIKMPDDAEKSEWSSAIQRIADEWATSTGMELDISEYCKVIQKDVNNYIAVRADGTWKAKGGWFKEYRNYEKSRSIINEAVRNYYINGKQPEDTVEECQELVDFQIIVDAGDSDGLVKRDYLIPRLQNELTARVFASNDSDTEGIYKFTKETESISKVSGSPEYCFIWNDSIREQGIMDTIDKKWYINTASERIKRIGG